MILCVFCNIFLMFNIGVAYLDSLTFDLGLAVYKLMLNHDCMEVAAHNNYIVITVLFR